jgi:hypothetical protein
MKEIIIERYAQDEEVLFADGLDDAIIGFNPISWQVVYDIAKCVQVLSRYMDADEAIEYLEYNTFNAYVGEKTPIWVDIL